MHNLNAKLVVFRSDTSTPCSLIMTIWTEIDGLIKIKPENNPYQSVGTF